MKSFLLIFFGVFFTLTVSAQKISEDKFGPQLQSKQKELYETVDKKEKNLEAIKKLEKEIEDAKTEADKKSKTDKKKELEKKVANLTTDIVSKCNDYREYRMFLKKHQQVSQEFLDKYKVRICNFYTDGAEKEKNNKKIGETELQKKQNAINNISTKIQTADNVIATLDKAIASEKKKIQTAQEPDLSNYKASLKKNQSDRAEKAKERAQLVFKIKSACEEFAAYKKLLKEKYKVEEVILEKYKVSTCALYQKEPVASADDIEKIKDELEGKEAIIEDFIDTKKQYEEEVLEAALEIKSLELKISTADDDDIKELTKELEEAQKKKKEIEEKEEEVLSQIRSSCKEFTAYIKYLKDKEGVDTAVLDAFKAKKCELYEEKPKLESERFVIVGDNAPVKFDSLFSNSSARRVLGNVFSIDSKTNLGTFEIPGDESFINFYAQRRNLSFIGINSNSEEGEFINSLDTDNAEIDSTSYAITVRQHKIQQNITPITSTEKPRFVGEVPEGALFKSIQIELREGGIVDTRLTLQSIDGKFEFYFEGTSPVSILHYTRKAAKRSFLKYSHYISLDGKGIYNENALKRLLVRYTDVLDYKPNAGSNYVPDDVSYKFPSEKEATLTDRRSYQVINNNHLQNVLDLRAYTDLLGLFGDEANGLFQVEGKADFFIHPFNFPRTALYYFKKVSPYVRYSRFDEDSDFVQSTIADSIMVGGETIPQYSLSTSKLSLLERSNLEMGLDINLLNFRCFKESPFWASIYFPLSYNVTKVRTDEAIEDNDANYRTLGFGFGLDLEIRRFNNFGLNVGYELKGHSFIGDYTEFGIIEPGYLKTQAVKAEIFYYPGIDRSNSVFLRMKSVRDIGSGGGDNFFQLQFGYRFTLGVGAIRAR